MSMLYHVLITMFGYKKTYSGLIIRFGIVQGVRLQDFAGSLVMGPSIAQERIGACELKQQSNINQAKK